MKGNMEERACQLALYIIENKATVRAAAQKFKISKSTVHKDLSERLPAFNRPLYLQAKQVLEENKAERHIRGGLATRKKYKGEYGTVPQVASPLAAQSAFCRKKHSDLFRQVGGRTCAPPSACRKSPEEAGLFHLYGVK